MSATALLLAAVLANSPGEHFAVPGAPQVRGCPDLREDLQRARDSRWVGPPHNAAPSRRGARARISKLSDLPKANVTLTVLRSIDGCAISSTVRYAVEGDGRAPREMSGTPETAEQ
jgi:hypothetical protein